MDEDSLSTNLRIFYDEMDARLKALSSKEQQQYLEGLVHAFDAMTRYANPAQMTPFDRENFIGAAKSWAYSRTRHLGLDPESRMQPLVESDQANVAVSYIAAVALHSLLGIPLTGEQQHNLGNVIGLAQMFKPEELRKLSQQLERLALPAGA